MLGLQHTSDTVAASPPQEESLNYSSAIPEYSRPHGPATKQGAVLLLLLFLVVAGIFVLDLITPVGVADGMLYVAAIMLTPWLPYRKAPFWAAGTCTVLTILGVIFSPGVSFLQFGSTLAGNTVTNRIYSILLIWATAILTYQFRRGTEVGLHLGSIVESSHDAIIGQTLEGRVTSWNKGAEHMFGYTAEESIGQLMTFIFPPERIPEEEGILAKLQQGQRIINFETVRRRKDGREIPVSLTISPIIDRWGNKIGASKIARDISHQKKVESLLALQTLSLAGHSAELKQSNTDLEQFAYIASHDLQEPLRTIHGFTQLLSERYKSHLDERAREYIQFVTDGVERMQTLIQDLLKYSRIQAQEVQDSAISGEDVLQDVQKSLFLIIEEKAARITHDPLPSVRIDRGHFHHLLLNLISNALKFHGAQPPRIHLSASEHGNHWQFAVRDHGIGIEPEYYQRVFLPFKRLHSRDEYTGTGIGLAICKKIVERRGGQIWVESEIGKGTTFFFTLPKPYGEPA